MELCSWCHLARSGRHVHKQRARMFKYMLHRLNSERIRLKVFRVPNDLQHFSDYRYITHNPNSVNFVLSLAP
jgi:hypothetical protein